MTEETEDVSRLKKVTFNEVVEHTKSSIQKIKKWTILRFGIVFLLAILVLCVIYGLKSTSSKQKSSDVVDFAFAVGDKLYAENLWLVVEIESNDRGLRTAQGKAISNHVCSAIKASQAVGWTPLVVGGKTSCCRSSSCRHLHPLDLKQLNLLSTKYFIHKYDYSSAMKVGAFMAAMKLGAVVIFHAHPEVYYNSGVQPDQYQKQLEYQLRKLTLGVSVGLVKGKEPKEASYFNPYQHFVPSLGNASDKESHRFKICEKEPPSLEKFLDNDGISVDLSAPSLTLPGKISSPFDTRNTAFSRSAFWSLLVLPDIGDVRTPKELNDEAVYIFRSVMAQTILAAIGGSTEFSVSQVATVENVRIENLPKDLRSVATYLDTWKCRSKTALGCLKNLGQELLTKEILSDSNMEVIENWITDLDNNKYEDVPTIKKSADPLYPCIEQDALVGVYFLPSVISNITEESSSREKEVNDHAVKGVQQLCPSVRASYLSTAFSSNLNKNENLVLIIAFSDKKYKNLPIFEALYRHHFKNILYCGEPDEIINRFQEEYIVRRGTFSFLPAHRQPAYECLLGALEMGYNVDGYLVVDEKTLINPWNFKDFDLQTIWHGDNDVQTLNQETIKNETKENPAIIQSTFGILNALQFLENVLLKPSNLSSTLVQVTKGRGRNIPTKSKRQAIESEVRQASEEEEEIEESSEPPEFSVNLFGELKKDGDDVNRTVYSDTRTQDKDVSELLLDPANFHVVDELENGKPKEDTTELPTNIDLTTTLAEIDRLFKLVNDKLNLWLKIVSSSDTVTEEDLSSVKDVQCDSASNHEICIIVAVFFKILKENQGPEFRLIYDDLPVYYVPSIHKEKLFILANLFTKFDIDEKMALPVLLRGLSPTNSWARLKFAELSERERKTTQLQDPQDLLYLSDGIDDDKESKELEQAHYLYPIDVRSILTNDVLKNIICRNFAS